MITLTQPQPVPFYSPAGVSHSHGKYFAAVVIVGIVALLVGAGIGYGSFSLQKAAQTVVSTPSTQFTYVHGTVDISPNRGTALGIYFDNQEIGTLTSVVTSQQHGYQIYVPTGKGYQITIYYYDPSTGNHSCSGRPSPFTPTGSDYSQNFYC